jgi:hypothetical protein
MVEGNGKQARNTFSEAVLLAHENIGGHEAFSKWAAKIQTDFYRIAARPIPTEIKNSDGEGLTVIVNRSGTIIDQPDDAGLVTSPSGIQTLGATKFSLISKRTNP